MSGDTAIRVALIGCGRIAQVHAGYLKKTPCVEFIGACDSQADARETFTRRWQLPSYASLDELVAAGQPEAVHITTPPSTHCRLAEQCLDAGLHVLVEKPMALSIDEADIMIGAARRNNRHLTVDHNRWFDPVVQRARKMWQAGDFGELTGIEVFQGAVVDQDDLDERQHWSASLPGGALYDSIAHPAYLLYGFLGDYEDLRVLSHRDTKGRIRELRAAIKTSRALGSLTISLNTRPVTNVIRIFGEKCSAEINLNNMTLIVRRTRQVPKVVNKVLPNFEEATQLVRATVTNTVEFVTGKQRYYPGMGMHFRELYAALSRGDAPPVSAEDGRSVMKLVDQLWDGVSEQAEASELRAVSR